MQKLFISKRLPKNLFLLLPVKFSDKKPLEFSTLGKLSARRKFSFQHFPIRKRFSVEFPYLVSAHLFEFLCAAGGKYRRKFTEEKLLCRWKRKRRSEKDERFRNSRHFFQPTAVTKKYYWLKNYSAVAKGLRRHPSNAGTVWEVESFLIKNLNFTRKGKKENERGWRGWHVRRFLRYKIPCVINLFLPSIFIWRGKRWNILCVSLHNSLTSKEIFPFSTSFSSLFWGKKAENSTERN